MIQKAKTVLTTVVKGAVSGAVSGAASAAAEANGIPDVKKEGAKAASRKTAARKKK